MSQSARNTASDPNLLCRSQRESLKKRRCPMLFSPMKVKKRIQYAFRRKKTLRWGVSLILLSLLAGIGISEGTSLQSNMAATVILTPLSWEEQGTYQVSLGATGVDPVSGTTVVRTLTVASLPQSAIIYTANSIPPNHASGQLTLVNNGQTDVTLPPTTITTSSGFQVSFPGPITIPASSPASVEVTGYALTPGPVGAFPALSVVQPCCASHILIKNTSAFVLRDPSDTQTIGKVQQSDIDQEATLIAQSLSTNLQFQVAGQQQNDEHSIAHSWQCQPTIRSDPRANSYARRFTVSVALACSEEVYNDQALQMLATRLLQGQMGQHSPEESLYQLEKPVKVTIIRSGKNPQGNMSLFLKAQGQWVYHFSQEQLNQLTHLIAGKSAEKARLILLRQEGIMAISLQSGYMLPTNAKAIHFIFSEDSLHLMSVSDP